MKDDLKLESTIKEFIIHNFMNKIIIMTVE